MGGGDKDLRLRYDNNKFDLKMCSYFRFFSPTFSRWCGHLGREPTVVANTTPRLSEGEGRDIHANSCSSTRKLHYAAPRTVLHDEGRRVSSNVRARRRRIEKPPNDEVHIYSSSGIR